MWIRGDGAQGSRVAEIAERRDAVQCGKQYGGRKSDWHRSRPYIRVRKLNNKRTEKEKT